jgi:hypothetical protein
MGAPRSIEDESAGFAPIAFDDSRVPRIGGVLDDNPVADTGSPGIFELEAKSARELCASRAGRRPHLVGAAVFGSDAGRDDLVAARLLKLLFEEGAEPQSRQFVHDDALHLLLERDALRYMGPS